MISFLLIAALAAPPEGAQLLAQDGVIAYAPPERVGDALPTQRLSEIYICPRCREAEEEWLKAHPE